ncbi:MAG: hypothetical protein JWL81_1432 [Verrucomicrobiales bacterium]|nr:hypothetical protein [Verrucomicrobiales bacterium]
MKSNGLSLVLFLAALGLGGWATWEHRERAGLEERLSAALKERDAYQQTATRKLALESKTNVRAEGPEGLGPENAEALAKELEKKAPPAAAAKDDKNPMSGMAKMMKDPAMRDAMKAQMRSQVEFMYRDLFDLLGLDATKQESLTKLLQERSSAGMELGLAMMGGEPISDEDKKKKMEEMKLANEESDKVMKELLGDADFTKFQQFEKSQPERQQLNALNGQLKDKGIGLSEQAESQLMDAMFNERTNFKYDVNFADQKNFDPSQFTEQNLGRFTEQQAELRGKILEKAGGILTPEQLDVFRKSQEQQAAMEKMGMEMGLKMMGGKKAE